MMPSSCPLIAGHPPLRAHQAFLAASPYGRMRVQSSSPPDLPTVMWGYGGIEAIAKHLTDWAERGKWSSWSVLAEDARKQTAKAVRTVKEQVRARQEDADSQSRFGGGTGCSCRCMEDHTQRH